MLQDDTQNSLPGTSQESSAIQEVAENDDVITPAQSLDNEDHTYETYETSTDIDDKVC